MKKTISVLLTLLLLLATCVPAFAADGFPGFLQMFLDPEAGETQEQPEAPVLVSEGSVPVITLAGNGEKIVDADGNTAYSFEDSFAAILSGDPNGILPANFKLKDSVLNALKAYIKGALTFDEDKFYDALQEEISKLTDRIQMDENGDPRYGTNVSRGSLDINDARMTTPNAGAIYNVESYHFWYDWRRSPLEMADQLDAYIEAVCEMTGAQQVGMSGRCLGAPFVLAYLQKYGSKNRLCGIALDCGMQYGQDPMSEAISGKFASDGDSILRFLTDMEFELDEWIVDLIKFMEASGMFDTMNANVKAPIYARVVKGVTSALALSTQFTFPSYWSMVSLRDYDSAMLHVFGKPGSEKRQKYAGLIEKAEAYHNQVQIPLDSILKNFAANGGKIAVISKYGFQLMPMCASRHTVADTYVSVNNSSMGATTSHIYDTLGDDYIRSRVASGLGKYISPDNQIDASTCLFPDYTWFIKGVDHNKWTDRENCIIYTVLTADRQYTVDDFDCTQFMAFNKENGSIEPMVAENMNTQNWVAEDPSSLTFFQRISRFFETLGKVLRDLFAMIRN